MAYLWLCKSPSISLKLMDFPGNVSRVPLAESHEPHADSAKTLGLFKCLECLSHLVAAHSPRLQPPTPILNAEFHASGPNQGELGTWDLCRQGHCSSAHFTGSYGYGAQNLQTYQRITRCCGSSTHYFLLTGCPPSKHLEMSTKKTWKFPGHSFLMQKSKPKKWWATDFFQLVKAMKSTNPLRIGLRLSNQPVFGERCWLCMIMLYYLLLVHCARARDTSDNVQAETNWAWFPNFGIVTILMLSWKVCRVLNSELLQMFILNGFVNSMRLSRG